MTDAAATDPAVSTAPDTAAVCPYLLAVGGAWRSSSPKRDHRCTAVAPATMLATDKQRRLCLVAEHLTCSTFIAAVAGSQDPVAPSGRPIRRPVTRTAPLVLDRGRMPVAIAGLSERGVGQSSLVALMAVAFGALVASRLGGGGPDLGPAAAGDAGSPGASVAASGTLAPTTAPSSPETGPSRTLVPSDVEPSAEPSPTPADPTPVSPTPSPSRVPTTYTVQSGDTLSGIAAEHGTTWRVLVELNRIEDPSRLRIGQVLELP